MAKMIFDKNTSVGKKTILIDMHAHSSGISKCCLMAYKEVIDTALKNGIYGIVLTNHYQKCYVADGNFDAFAKKYTSEYKLAKEYGNQVGCKVFFGAEITMEKHNGAHILLYGINETFIESNPTLFDLSQEDLYNLVKSVGGIVIQAHPYRKANNLLDIKFLDGIEVNCHPLYLNTYFEDLLKIATDNNLLLTCGGDYHNDTYRAKCGVYLPYTLQNSEDLAKYFTNSLSIKLCIHEPNTPSPYNYLYTRKDSKN